MKKIVLLSALVLLLSACSKESDVAIESELQAEALLTPENGTFVSLTKATDIASVFFGTLSDNPATKSNARIASTETIRDSKRNNEPSMYVVNYSGGGFVIVGATRNYYPILAYSDEGNFVMSENMGGIVVWLEETQEAIRQSESLDVETKSQMHNLWKQYSPIVNEVSSSIITKVPTPEQDLARDYRIGQLNSLGYICYSLASAYSNGLINLNQYQSYSMIGSDLGVPDHTIIVFGSRYDLVSQVEQLLSTYWHQGTPFNDNCNGQAAGCATIAMAQVMKLHKYPSTYTWSNMPDYGWQTLSTSSTQGFIRTVGDALGINYNSGSSGVKPSKLKSTFQNFGYTATLDGHNSTLTENELRIYHRPVIMTGYTSKDIWGNGTGDGHAWVCDGFRRYDSSDLFFVEFLQGDPGSYYYSSKNPYDYVPSLQNPSYYTTISYLYFHMNWGWGENSQTPPGWFASNDVSTHLGNFQYDRSCLYIK